MEGNEKPVAVTGVRRAFKEMADGTIRVAIDIDDGCKADFMRLFGEVDVPVAIARLAVEKDPAGPNKLAQRLDAKRAWESPAIWQALCHSDKDRAEYREWVAMEHPCMICRIEDDTRHPHHWRDFETGGGMSLKPADHWCVPLCNEHHMGGEGVHSFKGSSDQWLETMIKCYGKVQHPKYVAIKLMSEWNRQAFKDWAGIDSLNKVTEDHLRLFENEYAVKIL